MQKLRKKRGSAHTRTYPGKRVIVVLKNGERFIDKYRDTDKGCCIFDNHRVPTGEMKSMTIYRQMPDVEA